jgi:alpha-mannosidase
VYDNTHGVALFTRGLQEFEPLQEDKRITFGLTLLRAVGWIDKQQRINAPGAQLQRDLTAEFMLMPLDARRNNAELMRLSQSYRAPLRAVQYHEKPPELQRSYLSLDNEQVLMTALKSPQTGTGLIVRLLNPGAGDVGVNLNSFGTLVSASRLNMAEVHQEDITIEKGLVNITLEPHQIVTVRLDFK